MAGLRDMAMPGRGRCLFATRTFEKNGLLLRESPACVSPAQPIFNVDAILAVARLDPLTRREVEGIFAPALGDLPPAQAARVLGLVSCARADFAGELQGWNDEELAKFLLVWAYNGFVGCHALAEKKALFPCASRLNHSCTPNAYYDPALSGEAPSSRSPLNAHSH